MGDMPIPNDEDKANVAIINTNVGTLMYATGEVRIDFAAVPKYRYQTDGLITYGLPSTNTYIRSNLETSYVMISWRSKRLVSESKWEFALCSAAEGRLYEGLNTFVAFVDLDGNGEYTYGEPMGVTRDVNVSWNGTEIEIEMTADGKIAPNVALAGSDENSGSGSSAEGEAETDWSHVYVYRTAIDGYSRTGYGGILNPLVVEAEVGSRTYVNELDLIRENDFEFDSATFTRDVMTSPMVTSGRLAVTSVTYKVFSTPVVSPSTASNGVEFVRSFGTMQIVAKPRSVNTVVTSARPVFTWSLEGDGADTYTAFSIQITNSFNKSWKWTSGIRKMPPLDPTGVYRWTPPLYVNDLASSGNVFYNSSNYFWSVSVHNAKFQNAMWSPSCGFAMHVPDPSKLGSTNYVGSGAIKACVKYRGPADVNDGTLNSTNIVRVEAFTTPDFTGEPVGRGFVRGVTSEDGGTVWLLGLDDGTYYLRAFIDSDGDSKRSEWESWGYACPRGDIKSDSIYNPSAITVSNGKTSAVTFYIEDTDCDQDCLPDAWEYKQWSAEKKTVRPSEDKFLDMKGADGLNHESGLVSLNSAISAKVARLAVYGASAGMLSLSSGAMSSELVALALGIPTIENTINESTLSIKSISLDSGKVKLTVVASADEPAVGTVFVSDGKVTATIVVNYADTLDGTWSSTEVTKTFTINEGGVSDEFSFSLEELGLDASKGFFKVELKQ